jgi:hypothetical protein
MTTRAAGTVVRTWTGRIRPSDRELHLIMDNF